MIQRIEFKNLKGSTRTLPLSPINLITGRNSTGKSTILDAITLALIGHVPRLGRSPSATFQLASASPMSVCAFREEGVAVSTWTKSGSSVKAKLPEGIDQTPVVMMDFADFQTRTSTARAQFIFAMSKIDPSEFSFEKVIEFAESIEAKTDGANAAKTFLIGRLNEGISAARAESRNVAEWLADAIASVKEIAKAYRAKLQAAEGSAATAAERLQSMTAVEYNEADLAEAQRKHGAAGAAFLLAKKAVHDAATQVEASKSITEKLERLREDMSADDMLQTANDLEASMNEQLRVIDARRPVLADGVKERSAILDSEIQAARREMETLEATARAEAAKLQAQLAKDRCPVCKCSGDLWKPGLQAAYDAEEQKRQERTGILSDLIAAKLVPFEEVTNLIGIHAETEQEWREERQMMAGSASQIAKLRKTAAEIGALEARRAKIVTATPPSDEELATLASEVEKARTLSVELSEARTAAEAYKSAQTAAADAEQRTVDARDGIAVIKAAQEGLIDLQEKLAEKTVGKIVTDARKLTDNVLGWTLEYRDGDFGYQRGGQWVSSSTWSGSETRIAFAGIQAAFASMHPERVMLMDELWVIDTDRFRAMMERIAELIAEGFIHQFIGAGAPTQDGLPHGTHVIEFGSN